jgi:SAM-dependent methyltransferase
MTSGKKLQRGYGNESLGLRNIRSVYVRRTLANAVASAMARWHGSLPSGAAVLDVGCGAQPYRSLVEDTGFAYTGVDWPSSIHTAGAAAETVRHSLTETPWPFADGSFDAIVCTEVLEHIPDPQALLNESKRILKPGGKMLLTAPLLWPEHEAPHDYHRFTRYALKMVFEKAGFTVDRLDARGGWHLSMAWMIGIWSFYAVGKPWNYLTRLAAMPVMAILAMCDNGRAEGDQPMTLGFTVEGIRN